MVTYLEHVTWSGESLKSAGNATFLIHFFYLQHIKQDTESLLGEHVLFVQAVQRVQSAIKET